MYVCFTKLCSHLLESFFSFFFINKAEDSYCVFVFRLKSTLEHVNDKIAVPWMAKLAHFVSLSLTRMSLFHRPADCRNNHENTISVKINCGAGREISQHFLLLTLK